MRIVDWELAEIGDPAWDIGGALHDFISFWLYSLPITGNENPEQLISSTEYPLQNMKKAIRAFWRGYIKTAGLQGRKANELLIRSTRYCAARLIQKTYESHQSSSELSNTAFYMVQTSLNIMKNTDDAVIHLFGIPLNYELV
jgi:aminoglycoside phosphotransferase (APT) family kinase protein